VDAHHQTEEPRVVRCERVAEVPERLLERDTERPLGPESSEQLRQRRFRLAGRELHGLGDGQPAPNGQGTRLHQLGKLPLDGFGSPAATLSIQDDRRGCADKTAHDHTHRSG
jgi:hypothetical protein